HPTPELLCNAYRTETEAPAKKKHILITATHANAVLNGENITAFPPNTSLWYLLYTQVMQADGLSFRNVLIDSGPMFFKQKKSINQNIVKRDGDRIGIAELSIKDIGDKLQEMGLPRNNNLSVVAVEMFPLTNSWQMDIRQRKNPDAELLEE